MTENRKPSSIPGLVSAILAILSTIVLGALLSEPLCSGKIDIWLMRAIWAGSGLLGGTLFLIVPRLEERKRLRFWEIAILLIFIIPGPGVLFFWIYLLIWALIIYWRTGIWYSEK